MENVCEEINYMSRYLHLPIYLDSDYHKEYVREKMKEKDPNPDRVFLKTERGEKVYGVVKEMFEAMLKERSN